MYYFAVIGTGLESNSSTKILQEEHVKLRQQETSMHETEDQKHDERSLLRWIWLPISGTTKTSGSYAICLIGFAGAEKKHVLKTVKKL